MTQTVHTTERIKSSMSSGRVLRGRSTNIKRVLIVNCYLDDTRNPVARTHKVPQSMGPVPELQIEGVVILWCHLWAICFGYHATPCPTSHIAVCTIICNSLLRP